MPVGGAEDFALAVRRYFSQDVKVVFVCLRDLGVIGEELMASAEIISVLPIARSRRWNPFGAGRLAKWLRANGITHVHSQTYHAHTYAIPAARKAGCVSIFHQQKTFEDLSWRKRWVLGRLTRNASAVVALSEKTARDLTTTFKLGDGKVYVVPNAVDPAIFHPSPNPAEVRKALALSPLPLIGAIASLNTVKNHDATLAVAHLLSKKARNYRVIFVGEGRERVRLQEQIVRLNLEEHVTVLGNRRPVAPWLQALDLLVLPSHWEGQPMILLQALASGIPIVASAIEGNIATLGKEHPCLFPIGDNARYLALVEKILDDPDFKANVLTYQSTLKLPTAPEVARKLEHIYHSFKREAS